MESDHAVVAFDFPCHKVEVYPKPGDAAAIVGTGARQSWRVRAPTTPFAPYGTSGHKLVPRAGSVESIGFAGVELKNAQVQVVDLPSLKLDFGSKPAMLLGADLLGRYRLIYDHSAHRIWLRASSCK